MNFIESYEDSSKSVRFYFTHSDNKFTTGVMVIKPGKALPKHNRPLAVENLIQISGKCLMKIFKTEEDFETKEMTPGTYIQIPQATYHIHSNPYDMESVTLFRAEGDITAIMEKLRNDFSKVELT